MTRFQSAPLKIPTVVLSLSMLAAIRHGPAADFLDQVASPETDPKAMDVWPNQVSRANSDAWLVEHHDQLRSLQPRVLLINFSQEASRPKLAELGGSLFSVLAEASRYHGYGDSNAPVFLRYQLCKFVDLREPGKTKGNSSKVPLKPGITNSFNVDYNRFFSDEFAGYVGIKDNKDGHNLRLDELVDRGYVHEVWFFAEGTPDVIAYECVEEKPVYDEKFVRQPGKFVQAGNGGDPDQKWTGRSVRLGFINAARGIGCFLESLSHSIEGTANSGAIPYFSRYFREFAGFDLNTRYHLPFDSFYALWGKENGVEYPDENTAVVTFKGKTYRIDDYLAYGGNVHYPPNGRHDYDLENSRPVAATIEDWRIGNGAEGKDKVSRWTNERFSRYRSLAPDCMGPWVVYWRQNFPGLNNLQKDDRGRRMKNWWPFLFY